MFLLLFIIIRVVVVSVCLKVQQYKGTVFTTKENTCISCCFQLLSSLLLSLLFLSLYQAAVTVEISILLICFCSFDLFCPLFEKDSFIKRIVYCIFVSHYIVLFKPCLF